MVDLMSFFFLKNLLDFFDSTEEVTGIFAGLDRQLLILVLKELEKRRKCTIVIDDEDKASILGVKFA
jgi:hypothetical protein